MLYTDVLVDNMSSLLPLTIDGRFFRSGDQRVFLKTVTYGPFPAWWKEDHLSQLKQIKASGFNAIRMYERPQPALLDAAADVGLYVWVTLPWGWGTDFIQRRRFLSEARIRLSDFLNESGQHPALAGILVANEIPSEMVRWMGTIRVREAIESLISECRSTAPHLLYGYGNYPTTEYLEPTNADFTAFNIYLENQSDFESYLFRLQAIAGDRPVFVTEMGLDSRRNSEQAQADLLKWQVETSLRAGIAGTTVYSWTDAWQNGPREMTNWDFGLKDRAGKAKLALGAAADILPSIHTPTAFLVNRNTPLVSIIVCTYNGSSRIDNCLSSLKKLDYPNFEIIVIDDGSTDDTLHRATKHASVRCYRQDHEGLSAARNLGANHAKGEILAYTDDDCEADSQWINWLVTAYDDPKIVAAGGPNIPPPASGMQEAIVAAAEGAPSHILLTDRLAEHLPGCNLSIRRQALLDIGGFNPVFTAAGDDVDICWRLMDAGGQLAFVPSAFVWHRRRVSLWRYIQQQRGYGRAENILKSIHQERFTRQGDINWKGVVYTGGTARVETGCIIYHGFSNSSPYQGVFIDMMPRRPIEERFRNSFSEFLMKCTESIARIYRAHERGGSQSVYALLSIRSDRRKSYHEQVRRASEISETGQTTPRGMTTVYSDDLRQTSEWQIWSEENQGRPEALEALISHGWRQLENDSNWDLIKGQVRVLFATEHTEKDGTLTHVRLQHGDTSTTEISELKRILSQLD